MSLPVLQLTLPFAVECRIACTTRIQFSQLEEPGAAVVLYAERVMCIGTLHKPVRRITSCFTMINVPVDSNTPSSRHSHLAVEFS